jgi:hypothetical protein
MAGAAGATMTAALLMLICGFSISQSLYRISYQYFRLGIIFLLFVLFYLFGEFANTPSVLLSFVLKLIILTLYPIALMVLNIINFRYFITLFKAVPID